ncbi:Methylthioribose kinase [archaeon HR01]|nr:Methylthioribose kinase [archaeon HR01]
MSLEEISGVIRSLTDGEIVELKPLSGGVSCIVYLVSTSRGSWVVKKALPRLMVQDEWVADVNRVFRESACLKAIRELVGEDAAPKVLLEDRQHHMFVMEYGEGGVTWKEMLMKGVIDPSLTIRAAHILAKLHTKSVGLEWVREEFYEATNFHQLRIDPYILHTSRKHPDISGQLLKIADILWTRKMCLVHGDYSPKNILYLPDGRLWVLDCEPAHYGHPAFDIAFCTNHLLLKSIHFNGPAYLREARRLWAEYWRGVGWDGGEELEREAAMILSALMLARVDGKSPVEYLSEENRVRTRLLAKKMIRDGVDSFEMLSCRVEEELRRENI